MGNKNKLQGIRKELGWVEHRGYVEVEKLQKRVGRNSGNDLAVWVGTMYFLQFGGIAFS